MVPYNFRKPEYSKKTRRTASKPQLIREQRKVTLRRTIGTQRNEEEFYSQMSQGFAYFRMTDGVGYIEDLERYAHCNIGNVDYVERWNKFGGLQHISGFRQGSLTAKKYIRYLKSM